MAKKKKEDAPEQVDQPDMTEEERLKKEEEEEKKLRIESFRKAGDIHKQVVKFIKPMVKVGAKLLDICEGAEAKIKELGGEIGFPTNVCINEVAAHYSSPKDDETVIIDGDVVKVDIGVAVEGYTADGAFTVSFNKQKPNENLILAVETAVMKGIASVKPGMRIGEIGAITSKIIKGFGYNPIRDLSGHMIDRWRVHGAKEIPNIAIPGGPKFEVGEVYALECFASTGAGNIHRSIHAFIHEYDLSSDRVPIRNKITKRVIGWIGKNKKTLPFSTRELLKEFQMGQFAIRELRNSGKIHDHFVLKEEKDVYVAQWEHTFMITENGIEQFT